MIFRTKIRSSNPALPTPAPSVEGAETGKKLMATETPSWAHHLLWRRCFVCVRESEKERDSQTFQQTNDPVTAISFSRYISPSFLRPAAMLCWVAFHTERRCAFLLAKHYSVTLKTQTFSADVEQNHRPTDSSHRDTFMLQQSKNTSPQELCLLPCRIASALLIYF